MTNRPKPIRILLVDDLSSTRRALSNFLNMEADVEIVGTASAVRSALARIQQLSPDVVVTKFDLPDSVLTLLQSLNQQACRVPVVVFDAGLEAGSPRNIDARLAGATSCVARPAEHNALAGVVQGVLSPAIRKAINNSTTSRQWPDTAFAKPEKTLEEATRIVPAGRIPGGELTASNVPSARQSPPASVVAIAASTGGPDALAEVLTGLPFDFSVPIVIVQHMPSGFTVTLAERLATQTGRRVAEGCDSAKLHEAQIWIAPGGRHMLVERRGRDFGLRLSDDEPESSCRPSADVLFRSVAKVFGSSVLGVVLTGMGHDGLEGSRCIRDCGGQVIIQDQATSVVWAMPRAVAEAKLQDAILPVTEIAREIHRRCRRSET
jgi:two-component system, chemotaxis family, protein-glutamate methylesterase/glutaminase